MVSRGGLIPSHTISSLSSIYNTQGPEITDIEDRCVHMNLN